MLLLYQRRVNPVSAFLRKAGGLLLWPLVAGYMLLNELLWPALRPLVLLLARQRLFERLRAWLLRLHPYAALVLLAVPFAIIEPLKAVALYWSAEGHALTGLGGLALLQVLSLLSTERLFAVLKPKLLTIGWFAWIWRPIERVRERLLAWLVATPAWLALRRAADAARTAVRRWIAVARAR